MSIFEYYENQDPLLRTLFRDDTDADTSPFAESRQESRSSAPRDRWASATARSSERRRRDEHAPDAVAT